MNELRGFIDCWLKKRVLFFFIAFVLPLNIMAQTREVAADGSGDYTTLNDALTAGGTVDTVILMGSGESYTLELINTNVINNGVLFIIGSETNPDSFPVLLRGDNFDAYNVLKVIDMSFENLVITDNNTDEESFENGQSENNTYSFKNCVIRDCESPVFFELNGEGSPTLNFENCLFTGNKTIFRFHFWNTNALPDFNVINCTFDNNDTVFVSQGQYDISEMMFTNCIFSNNEKILPNQFFNIMISYSLTSEDTAGYGPECVPDPDPLYVVEEDRQIPSDWIPQAISPAKEIGNAQTAPESDISSDPRTEVVDAGCWNGELGGPPIINEQPLSDTIGAGDNAVFVVEAAGLKPLKYSWYKKGDEDPLDTSTTVNSIDTFLIGSCTLDDDGSYYCVIENDSGEITTDTVRLVVVGSPVIDSITPQDTTVIEGETIDFTITAKGGLLGYQWYKNEEEIEDETGPVLSITAGIEDDGNVYTCIVSNDSGNVTSDEAVLHVVSEEPQFIVHPEDTTVFEGAEVTFTVDATGKAPVTFTWFRSDSETELGEGKTYTIESVSMEDSAVEFYCVASNSAGSVASDSAVLTVEPSVHPVIISEPQDMEIREGYSAEFLVSARGSDLEFAWYKDGEEEIIGTDSVLLISSVVLSDSGMYYCVISNFAGEEQSQMAKLTVLGENEPFNPVELSGQFIDRKTVILTVESFSDINTEEGESLYADTIGIWYEIDEFPSEPDINSTNLIKLSIMDLKENGATDTFTLNEGISDCFSYYFVASVFWHNPDTVTSFQFQNGTSIYMCSTQPIDNQLIIEEDYVTGEDSMVIHISNLESVNRDSISYLKLWCEIGNEELFSKTIEVDELTAENEVTVVFKDDPVFYENERRIVWKLLQRGILGNVSDTVKKEFQVGIPRPDNLLVLQIEEIKNTSVKLSWQLEPDEIYDSIKIWYGTEQIPLTFNPDETVFEYQKILGTEEGVTIEELSENTLYYFGVQIRQNGFWSYITEGSRDSARTEKNVDPEKIINSIQLKEIEFDTSTNKIKLSWSIDTVGISQYDLQTGINWAPGIYPKTTPFSSSPIIPFDKTLNTYQYEFDPGEAMIFDTLYYVSLWLRVKDKQWSDPSDDARDTVRIPPLKWQAINYFKSNDTINTFNRKVYMWMDPVWIEGTGVFNNVLNVFRPDEIPDGFIPVSTGVEFENKQRSPNFHFGIQCDSLPADYKITDVNIYQFDEESEKWIVLEKTGVDSDRNIVSIYTQPEEFPLPFILMIDTCKPVVTLNTDTDSAVNAMQEIETELVVKDNISNVKVDLWCGLGSEKLSLINTVWGENYNETFKFTIPAQKVTADNGVRALLVINDGLYTDTVNISRKVFRDPSADAISTVAGKWVPLVTTTYLYNNSIDTVLNDLHEDGGFEYNKKQFRIYRYSTLKDELNETNKWIEYSDDPEIKPLFDLIPGRVLWIKTREAETLRLGAGETVTLKNPYTIEIKAKDWTDICLPFRFNVCIGDILENSDISDEEWSSIWVYSWQETENAANLYSTPYFMPLIPDMDEPGIELKYNNDMGQSYNIRQTYTVYNNLDRNITLKIPSVPSVMSEYVQNLGKRKKLKGWSVKVNAKTNEEILNPVICAYTPGEGKTYLKSGPGFGDVRLYVQNPDNNSLWGHIINHELKDGGVIVPLMVKNGSGSKQKLNMEIERGKSVPENTKIIFANPENGNIQYLSKMEMDIEPGSTKNGWLIAGDSIYIASWYKKIVTTEFTLLKMFPNPCRGRFMVRFTMPYTGVKEVKMMIYDQLGRKVWSKIINRRLHPGLNVVHCDISAKESFAAGTYIFNIKALNQNGNVIGTKRNRLTFIP